MPRPLRPSLTRELLEGAALPGQHETPDLLRLLLADSVGLQARDETGAETLVKIFGVGELPLAPAVILGMPHPALGLALTDMPVLVIPADAFREGIPQHSELGRAAPELLARHWRLRVDR